MGSKAQALEWYYANKDRAAKTNKKWHADNKDRRRANARARYKNAPELFRDSDIKRKFGITLADKEAMLLLQGGCGICGTGTSGGKGWAIDHCHMTKKVRGVLCNNCNFMLGHAKDNIKTLFAAIAYLKDHQKQ